MPDRTDEEVQTEGSLLQAVRDDVGHGLILTDAPGAIRDANEAACEMFGYSRGELRSLTLDDILECSTSGTPDGDDPVEVTFTEQQPSPEHTSYTGRPRNAEPLPLKIDVETVPGKDEMLLLLNITDPAADSNPGDFLEEILDSSGVGTFILDQRFNVIWVNRAIETFFGIDRNDLLGEDKRTLIKTSIKGILEHPDQFQETLLRNYASNSRVDQFECHVLPDNDRPERWLLHRSRPIESGPHRGGRIEHYTDITKQKQTEAKLRYSENRYRQIVEHSPDGIFVFNDEGGFLEVNPAAVNMTGYSRPELLSKTIFDLAPEQFRNDAREHLRTLKTGEQTRLELPVVTKSGERRFWQIEASELSDNQIFSVAKDVTEKRKIEARRRETEKQFRLMAEQSEAVIWLTEPKFEELLFINSRYETVFGGDRKRVLEDPMNVLDDIHPDDHDDVKRAIQDLINGEQVEMEYRINPATGFSRWAHAWGSPVRDDGEIRYLMGSVRDITDQKQRETELREIARTDELTGLPNRKALFERLTEEVQRVRRYGSDLSLAILDIDNFKTINDQYGHQVGDDVLRRTSTLLEDSTREADFPGRYGGEEFAVIFPETGRKEAAAVTERIRKHLDESSFTIDDHEIDPCWSGGITSWTGSDETLEDLVGRADTALYEAKSSGRNRIVTG